MAIHRNHIQKCFKRELETSQIMNVQSGFYSQIGNLSTVPMWRTAHLSKYSRLSISTLISHVTKNVSILKHPASFTYEQMRRSSDLYARKHQTIIRSGRN